MCELYFKLLEERKRISFPGSIVREENVLFKADDLKLEMNQQKINRAGPQARFGFRLSFRGGSSTFGFRGGIRGSGGIRGFSAFRPFGIGKGKGKGKSYSALCLNQDVQGSIGQARSARCVELSNSLRPGPAVPIPGPEVPIGRTAVPNSVKPPFYL